MIVSDYAIELVKSFEELSLEAYLCPAGVWTIGYGHTHGVKEGDKIDEQRADYLLKSDMSVFSDYVLNMVTYDISQNQFDALSSLVFNIGPTNFKNSTLLKKLNKGDSKGASSEFSKWRKGGGVILKGLVQRRKTEKELFDE
jgi:lysozyme